MPSSNVDRVFAQLFLGLLAITGLVLGGLWLLARHSDRQRTEEAWRTELRSPSADARAQTLATLASEREVPLGLLPEIAYHLGDSDAGVRRESIALLARVGGTSPSEGEAVATALSWLLLEGNLHARRSAVAVLNSLGPRARNALPALLRSVESADAEVRASAASAVASVGVGQAALALAVDALTRDAEPDVRASAVEAMASLRPDAQTAAVARLLALRDSSSLVRLAAVYALSRLDDPLDDVRATLDSCLSDARAEVRRASALALARMSGRAAASLPHLERLRRDSVAFVRQAAEHAIEAMRLPDH